MAKEELKLHAVVAPTETVIVSAYDETGRADACTLAFYMVSSHIPPCVMFLYMWLPMNSFFSSANLALANPPSSR